MTLNPEKPEDILRDMEVSGDLHVDETLGTNEDARGPFFEHLAGVERSDNVTELFEAAYSLMMDTVMEYPLDGDGYVNQRDFEEEVTNTLGDVIIHIERAYSPNHPHVITTQKEILQSLVRELETRDKQNTKDLRPRLAIGYIKDELRKLIAEEYTEVDSREVKTESRSLPEDVRKILFSFNSLVGGFKQVSNDSLSLEEKSEIRGIVDAFLSEQYEQNPASLYQALKVMKEEQEEAMDEDVDGRWDEAFERIDSFCDIHKLDVGQDDDEEDDNWWRKE